MFGAKLLNESLIVLICEWIKENGIVLFKQDNVEKSEEGVSLCSFDKTMKEMVLKNFEKKAFLFLFFYPGYFIFCWKTPLDSS